MRIIQNNIIVFNKEDIFSSNKKIIFFMGKMRVKPSDFIDVHKERLIWILNL
jgi:hypothetical protein